MSYPEEPSVPTFVAEAGAADLFRDLEPPITDIESGDLQYYYREFGDDGVLAALHFFAEYRNAVPDPSYPTILQAFSPGIVLFTDEELNALPPVGEEELRVQQAKYDAQREVGERRWQLWSTEGIRNPGEAYRKIEEVRRTKGDAAADEYHDKLFEGIRPCTPEEETELRLINQRHAADRQRKWQALPAEEQRLRIAKHRVFLFRLMRGDFYEEDETY
jgi:hypothetical protein